MNPKFSDYINFPRIRQEPIEQKEDMKNIDGKEKLPRGTGATMKILERGGRGEELPGQVKERKELGWDLVLVAVASEKVGRGPRRPRTRSPQPGLL